MKILVIDDDPLSLSGLQMVLEQRGGHACVTFQDPEAAVQAFCCQPFDAVITDLRMPRMSGVEVMRAVRRIDPAARVILVTGFREQVDDLADQEAYAYFLKPLRTRQLLDTLNRIELELGQHSTGAAPAAPNS